MGTNSNDQGRAYEYAWIQTLYKALSQIRNTKIVRNSSLEANVRAWAAMTPMTQDIYLRSADAAVDAILELEPRMIEEDEDVLTLEFQKDDAGTYGDVRDIVIRRDDICWEVGLSIKHNHEAVKHSRLSHRLDFGNEWFGIPCSDEYWNTVTPIFDRLKHDKSLGIEWNELDDKEDAVYIPLLEAFLDEVGRAYEQDCTVPQKMVEYLIGIEDYYKIVSHDSQQLTMIHTFNLHDTLNKPSRVKVSTISVPVVDLPTEIVTMRFKPHSTNTVEIYMNNGWQMSFRIHNASTRVEPSLKFDVQFIGMPVSILNIECKWNRR